MRNSIKAIKARRHPVATARAQNTGVRQVDGQTFRSNGRQPDWGDDDGLAACIPITVSAMENARMRSVKSA